MPEEGVLCYSRLKGAAPGMLPPTSKYILFYPRREEGLEILHIHTWYERQYTSTVPGAVAASLPSVIT